jgi:metal-responsive CopG/Arc/MetJ family transcriptional regulator
MVARVQFLLRLPQSLKDAITVEADKAGVTRSQWIRSAIQEKMDRSDTSEDLSAQSEKVIVPHKRGHSWWL